ncbi:MAG: glycosyltransferase [Allomuricauda sp.]
MNAPIVVVAYNRPRSLTRLLRSLTNAKYPEKEIDLLISIDRKEDNQEVLAIANAYEWKHGAKKVIYQEKNLGLRKHILQCGNLSLEYGSVIVLEDDLFVSPNFYFFVDQALRFSTHETKVGGISLYNHRLNVHTRDNFSPTEDGYDNWYFQFASSWGQAWTKEQWAAFMKWYENEPDIDHNGNVPAYVRSWSAKSWLKYNIAYLVEKDLYFIYPKISLSTNFSDAGTHVGNDSTIYQVPLDQGQQREYRFSTVNQSKAVYDAFYENVLIGKMLGIEKDDLCIDLHGYRHANKKRYLLSSRLLDHKILRSYGKSLKPQDDNILNAIEGLDFFLYDTSIAVKNPHQFNLDRNIEYNFKQLPYKSAVRLFYKMTMTKFKNLRRKIFKI